jgi:hypothetical protein
MCERQSSIENRNPQFPKPIPHKSAEGSTCHPDGLSKHDPLERAEIPDHGHATVGPTQQELVLDHRIGAPRSSGTAEDGNGISHFSVLLLSKIVATT